MGFAGIQQGAGQRGGEPRRDVGVAPPRLVRRGFARFFYVRKRHSPRAPKGVTRRTGFDAGLNVTSMKRAAQDASRNAHRAASGPCVRLPAAYHSATLPSAWRHTGLRQRWPVFAISRTFSSFTSMPRPGPCGIDTKPSSYLNTSGLRM